jgi:hypothetical protein
MRPARSIAPTRMTAARGIISIQLISWQPKQTLPFITRFAEIGSDPARHNRGEAPRPGPLGQDRSTSTSGPRDSTENRTDFTRHRVVVSAEYSVPFSCSIEMLR